MSRPILFVLGSFAFIVVVCREKICTHLPAFGNTHNPLASPYSPDAAPKAVQEGKDTVYIWDDKAADVVFAGFEGADSEPIGLESGTTDVANVGAPGDPVKVTWKMMQAVKFKKQYYKEVDGEMLAPIFTDTLKKLEGKMVEVEGYVIPVDEKWRYVALSANPYASCFFCGKAGPASVMTVKFRGKSKKKYETDDYVHFKGKLRLNQNNVEEFYFVLENSEALDK